MGQIYRFDHITKDLFIPKVLSFRLTIEIPEHLCGQLQEYLDEDEPPATTFLSQIYAKKIGEAFYLVIVVNLLSFYEEWSKNPLEPDYKTIISELQERIALRFGKQFTEYFITDEKLDCDFIEYSFIVEDENVHVGMFERHADPDQLYKLSWDEHYYAYIQNWGGYKYSKEPYTPTKKYSNFMLGLEYNYRKTDNELYLRCDGHPLQDFFMCLEKPEYIAKRGIQLQALYDINIARTICQEAYECNCWSRGGSSKSIKDLYQELCTECSKNESSECESSKGEKNAGRKRRRKE